MSSSIKNLPEGMLELIISYLDLEDAYTLEMCIGDIFPYRMYKKIKSKNENLSDIVFEKGENYLKIYKIDYEKLAETGEYIFITPAECWYNTNGLSLVIREDFYIIDPTSKYPNGNYKPWVHVSRRDGKILRVDDWCVGNFSRELLIYDNIFSLLFKLMLVLDYYLSNEGIYERSCLILFQIIFFISVHRKLKIFPDYFLIRKIPLEGGYENNYYNEPRIYISCVIKIARYIYERSLDINQWLRIKKHKISWWSIERDLRFWPLGYR